MPPLAIASRLVVTTSRAASAPLCTNARNMSSRFIVDGNLGAAPKPPHCGSNV